MSSSTGICGSASCAEQPIEQRPRGRRLVVSAKNVARLRVGAAPGRGPPHGSAASQRPARAQDVEARESTGLAGSHRVAHRRPLAAQDRGEEAHAADQREQQRGEQRRAHLGVVAGEAPAARPLGDAPDVQVRALQPVGDGSSRRSGSTVLAIRRLNTPPTPAIATIGVSANG